MEATIRPAHPIRRLLLSCAVLLCAAGYVLSGPAPTQAPAVDRGRVYLQPFGANAPESIHRAAWALRNATAREVVVLPTMALPPIPQGAARDAGQLLDQMLVTAPDDTFRIAGLTTVALRARGMGSVTGYARDGERGLMLSTYDLPVYATEAAHRRRLRRVIAHELGHTMGALHCERDCVMRSAYSAANIDIFPDHYCPEHRRMVESGMARSRDSARTLKQLGSERLRLGLHGQSVQAFERAARKAPKDARIQVSLGVAMMAEGRLVAAEEAFQKASMLEPQAPQPYYARAVLYAAGFAPARAPAYIEAAVRRDGDPARAHRAAGILYQDLLSDDRGATRHFQLHVSRGGRSTEVISRLVKLLSPTTLVIDQAETIVATYRPDEGLILASLVLR